jgi:hypothetical protein
MSLCYYKTLLQGFARQVETASSSSGNKIDTGRLVTNELPLYYCLKSQEDYYKESNLVKKDGQVPMKDRLSFKLLMKAEDLRKSSYRSDFNSAG